MPDTQCYTLFAPEVMEAQTRFIEEQLTSRNIVNNGFYIGERQTFTERDRVCIPPPYFH